MMWRLFAILFVFICSKSLSLELDKLQSLGISEHVYISDIAVYLNKAFLAVPRSVCTNNITQPTFVEVPWKEYNVILKNRMNRPLEGQLWANCDDLQDAFSLSKETVKSKLWILDRGNQFCKPKLMVYSWLQNSFLNEESVDLGKVASSGLNTLVVENGTTLGDHRAFIANAGENKILSCSLKSRKCTELELFDPNNPTLSFYTHFLSYSKLQFKMFFTGVNTTQLYSADMGQSADYLQITNCGETLGPSSGLDTDLKNGLIYYLTRDYAIVRWTTDQPLRAEFHNVLAQSYNKLPFVSRIFTDSQDNVYALTNYYNPTECRYLPANTTLDRAVKVMKYNWILDTFI